MEKILDYKDTIGGISDVDLSTHTIKGYASVFGNVDSDNDIIERGAYTKTVKEWGPTGKNRIKLCWQHDITDPMGKSQDLFEDHKGLGFIAVAPKGISHIDDRLKMIEGGIIDELSVGFIPIKVKNANGIRSITEIKLYEYSLVTLAANEMAKITSVKGVVGIDTLSKLEAKGKKIISMLKNGDLTDEGFHALEYYHNQLIKNISDLLAAPPEKGTQQPAPSEDTQDKNEAEFIAIQTLKNSLKWN